MCAHIADTRPADLSFKGNTTKTSGSAYPTHRKAVCVRAWFHYSFSIFVIITTTASFLSLVALAKCDRLPDYGAAAAGSVPSVDTELAPSQHTFTTLGVTAIQSRLRRSAVGFDANADYSYASKTTAAVGGGGGGGVDVGSAVSAPQLLVSPHDHLAAFGYRTKQKPQQFFQRQDNQIAPQQAAFVDSADLTSLSQVKGGEDICKTHCKCERVKSAFIHINCDFRTNTKLNEEFGSNFRVPPLAISITIKLAERTHFCLKKGFFNKDNRVNSLTIEGSYSEGEQVEITTEAFHGNQGSYPEILMQNVFSVIVRSKAFSANGIFTVRNSNDVIVYADAFENAQINGYFVHINDFRIQEKAFNSAQAKLRIESSHIDNIYRFEASLREIRFTNCTIGTINGGTFDVNNINSIVFEGCRIDAIKARAITEKLYSKHVSITGATIGSIESEAIYGSGISELTLANNKIDTIQANAIHVTAINATIAHNNIKRLENNWLRVKDWSNIVIEKNQFGVFGSMQLEETKQPTTCHFYSNSLTQPLPGSLNITNHYCYMREISVNLPCRCNLNWLEVLSSRDLRSEVYCTIDDKLGHCFNSTTFNTLKYINEVCDDAKSTLDCVANMNLKKIDGRFFTAEELAADNRLLSKLLFVIGGCVLLLLLVIILIFVAFRCFCRNGKAQTNSSSIPHVQNHLHEFSDEELRIVDQTMQMLQKKYPEIQKQIYACTQKLLRRDLSDKKCVKTVSQILELLNVPSQQTTDFIAFNQVLTQHLQPPQLPLPSAPTPSTTDPIYSEPTIRDIEAGEDGFYTSSTIVPIVPEGYTSQAIHGGGQTHLPEHIYAEPNCAQQPLLRNEYASPADGNIDSLDLYTEPINDRGAINPANTAWITSQQKQRQRPPQYAVPTLARNQIEPLSSFNFPDVVYQGNQTRTRLQTQAVDRPLTNVQRIAQDLQGMPKFQLNRPQNFHLLTPAVYTAPDMQRKKPLQQQITPIPQLATPERDEDFEMDMRGAAALPTTPAAARNDQQVIDSSSDHSGGSNETVKMDDIIEYVDA